MTTRLYPQDPTQPSVIDLYGSQLAQIHHSHFGVLAREAAAQLLGILSERGLHSGTILELACGGGISTRILADAGYNLVGVDISKQMLDLAGTHAPMASFRQASLWDCPLPESQAITAIGEAFCYGSSLAQPDPETLESRLGDIYKALCSDGVLLFDVATPGRSGPTGKRQNAWEKDNTFVYLHEEENSAARSLVRTIDSFVPSGDLHRHSREQHHLSLFETDAVEKALQNVGFEPTLTTQLGDFKLLPGWVAFVAIKP